MWVKSEAAVRRSEIGLPWWLEAEEPLTFGVWSSLRFLHRLAQPLVGLLRSVLPYPAGRESGEPDASTPAPWVVGGAGPRGGPVSSRRMRMSGRREHHG